MATEIQLEPVEARVLGVLIEKELTTPEQYPLSLNALTNGCNQKSNRHPVLSLSDDEVQQAILKLRVAQLVEFVQLVGQRVEKYRHRAGQALHLETPAVAVLAELLLRGAQSAGELRSRVERMTPLPTLADLDAVLAPMLGSGLVVRRAPEPGSRAVLYAQTLCQSGAAATDAGVATARAPAAASAEPPAPALPSRNGPADLGARVDALEAQLAELRARIDRLSSPD
jgi:uncharacterized protein YceH (UPF0502 family)